MNHFLNWREHVGSQAEKFYKTTLWQGDHLMIGLNCLEPGQKQRVHAHDGADKFYFVLEGHGKFTGGDSEMEGDNGSLVVAPAGISQWRTNNGSGSHSLPCTSAP